jgi:signal transduction histidine kinase
LQIARPNPLPLDFVVMKGLNRDRRSESGIPGPRRIGLEAAPAEQGEIVLHVDDDGPGIPDSLRRSLFKPFMTTKSKGNGFGLAICKKIVEEHGGTIEIGSSPLGGARFEIRIPVKP